MELRIDKKGCAGVVWGASAREKSEKIFRCIFCNFGKSMPRYLFRPYFTGVKCVLGQKNARKEIFSFFRYPLAIFRQVVYNTRCFYLGEIGSSLGGKDST